MFFEPVIGGYATREGRARSSMPSVTGKRSRGLAQLSGPIRSGVLWRLITPAAARCFSLDEALERNRACRKPIGTADDFEAVARAGDEVNFIRSRLPLDAVAMGDNSAIPDAIFVDLKQRFRVPAKIPTCISASEGPFDRVAARPLQGVSLGFGRD
jgi:hypothetical protein